MRETVFYHKTKKNYLRKQMHDWIINNKEATNNSTKKSKTENRIKYLQMSGKVKEKYQVKSVWNKHTGEALKRKENDKE